MKFHHRPPLHEGWVPLTADASILFCFYRKIVPI